MDQSKRQRVAREARYTVQSTADLRVVFEPNDCPFPPVAARLVDISQHGARLQTETHVQPGDPVAVTVVSQELRAPIVVDATVRWSRAETPRGWTFGIQFEPAIPHFVLSQLAHGGHLNRRYEERIATSLRTSGNWELCPQPFSGRITDLCEGGFCMTTTQGGSPGTRVMLRFAGKDDSVHVTARSQWQVQHGDEYVSGCQFISPNGYSVLRNLISQYGQAT